MYGNIYRQSPMPYQLPPKVTESGAAPADPFVPCNRAATMLAIAVCWGAVSGNEEPLWQNSLTTEVVVNDPPPKSKLPETILQSWYQPPQPHQRQTTHPIVSAVAPEQPPYKRQPESVYESWVSRARIDRWQISVGEGVEVNDPPPSTRAGFYAVMRHWIPPDPQPVQRLQRQTVSVEQATEQPPYKRQVIPAVWFEPYEVTQRRVQITPLTLVYGDQPPPLKRQALPTLEPEQPQQRRNLTIVSVDQPPPLARRQPQWSDVEQPQQRLATYPIQPEVAAEQPPFQRQPESILASWIAPDQPRQRRVEIVPLTLTYGDQPPRQSHVVLDTIVRSWEPPHHYDWRRPPFIFGVQVNEPPPLKLAQLNLLYQICWLPPPPQPTQRDLKIAPLTLIYGDQPPKLARQQIPQTTAEHHQQRRATVPIVAPAAAEQPAFTRQPQAIIDSWLLQPLPSQPRTNTPIASTDDPPPLRRRSVHWQESEWPQQRRLLAVPLSFETGICASYAVSSGGDDAGYIPTSTFTIAVGQMRLGNFAASPGWGRWDRMTNLAIPRGAIITKALLTIRTTGAGDGSLVRLKTHLEAADDPAMPANVADADGRSLTTGTAWTVVSTGPLTYPATITVDITAELQTIVNRAGWLPGHAINIVTKDNLTSDDNYLGAYTYNNSPATAAELRICYLDPIPPRSLAGLLANIRQQWETEPHRPPRPFQILSFGTAGPMYRRAGQLYEHGSKAWQLFDGFRMIGQMHEDGPQASEVLE